MAAGTFVASLTKASFSVVPLQAACAPSPGTPGVAGAAAPVPGLRRAGKLLPANPSPRDTRCTPLLREGNLITTLIRRATLIALPAWQDAAAARGGHLGCRGNPSRSGLCSPGSAHVLLPRKTIQGCFQPESGLCKLFRIPVCAWDWVEVLPVFLIVMEKMWEKMKKMRIALCLFLLYVFISAKYICIFFFKGTLLKKDSESIFSSSFKNENKP